MNDDDFEKKLHALTGALHRPDPTPAWKADILARARREADAIPVRRMAPPRWLMLGWAACWVVTIALHSMTPGESRPAITDRNEVSRPAGVETNPLVEHQEALLAMLEQNDFIFANPHP